MVNREEGKMEIKFLILSVTCPYQKVTAQRTSWPFHPCGGTLKSRPQAEAIALLIVYLPNMLGALDSVPSLAPHKWGMMVHTCNPST